MNKHRPQLIITFNKLKKNGLFKSHRTYEKWEKRNEKKEEKHKKKK